MLSKVKHLKVYQKENVYVQRIFDPLRYIFTWDHQSPAKGFFPSNPNNDG